MRSAFPFSFWKPSGPPPTVTSITPVIGFVYGKSSVAIAGSGFLASTPTVNINGAACTSVVVIDDNNLTAITGASTRNALSSVNVTTVGGTNTPNTLWEYADPANCPGGGTATVWLNTQNVTTIAGPFVNTMTDMSGNGRTGLANLGFEPTYIASSANFNGFPSVQPLNTRSDASINYTDAGLGATNQSYCMVGFGDPTHTQNYWWNSPNAKYQGAIFPAPKNMAVDSNGNGTQLVWSNATDGITTPGVVVTAMDGTAAAKLAINALTPITGDAGTLGTDVGTSFAVGSRGATNITQNINGEWTDFLQYNSMLSTSDIQYLQRIFGAIYNITINA